MKRKKEKIKRPFVFLCTGMSLDGKISNCKKECSAISSNDDRRMLYDHRIIADAVMIGGNTLKLDDSCLNVKTEERQRKRIRLGKTPEPVKVCVVSNANDLKTKGDFFDKGDVLKVIFTTSQTSKEKLKEIRKKARVHVLGKENVDLKKALSVLHELGIKKLLVEGGGELIFSLLKGKLVDEINLKVGDLIIGGRNSVTFVDGEGFDKLNAKKVKILKITKRPNYIILKAKVIY